ncbi:MAG: hypothetical protein ACD_41C00038G0004 [uncultured bacterium]|nr:MAG: hypothetical protein ACD_41C00038G0004 [uncultured bacterium]HBY73582.1 hypothetical protein [Candidatus Kerfeldbacteria bacterium]
MKERLVIILPSDQQPMACPSCKAELEYSIVPNTWPHLYCTHCKNAYHETHGQAGYKRIIRQRLANRKMHAIQSHAPVCECGGLFLFNAFPHCLHCGYEFSFGIPTEYKARLLHPDLVVFDGTKLYLDNGTHNLYQFGA